ncbi:hypothetical protein PS623_04420 [Pseudomonas fluorescens]|jgi:hypothetical protein|uniref:hypothetical protein n=1 Tax=Pseudomonas TaxID=286 RepID=UPI00124135B8|nr:MULTISPECIES: hypothetical protein [Pseudomonas]QYX51611.1 hypothetical protein K3F44_18675 [Pseudomonas sp. S07E 245]VVN23700.1 hypothetical protein PS623_04420 [Pseudomonas fluorescens]
MIADDFELIKQIFSNISSNIFEEYDSFGFDVEVGDGYVDYGVVLHKDGATIKNAKMEVDEDLLSDLIRRLRANAESRGEPWKSFVLSYKKGEQVKTKFTYGEK